MQVIAHNPTHTLERETFEIWYQSTGPMWLHYGIFDNLEEAISAAERWAWARGDEIGAVHVVVATRKVAPEEIQRIGGPGSKPDLRKA